VNHLTRRDDIGLVDVEEATNTALTPSDNTAELYPALVGPDIEVLRWIVPIHQDDGLEAASAKCIHQAHRRPPAIAWRRRIAVPILGWLAPCLTEICGPRGLDPAVALLWH
jgi:hypothetical protein